MKSIMGNGLVKCIAFPLLQATALSSCAEISKEDEGCARAHSTIDPLDREVMPPMLFDDSIIANLVFDSRASLGVFTIDSTFCSVHPFILSNLSFDTIAPYGCVWSVSRMSASMYTVIPTIRVGNANLMYDKILVYSLRDYMGDTQLDGMFSIPQNDTVNIWELNFEHHYMAIHSF